MSTHIPAPVGIHEISPKVVNLFFTLLLALTLEIANPTASSIEQLTVEWRLMAVALVESQLSSQFIGHWQAVQKIHVKLKV